MLSMRNLSKVWNPDNARNCSLTLHACPEAVSAASQWFDAICWDFLKHIFDLFSCLFFLSQNHVVIGEEFHKRKVLIINNPLDGPVKAGHRNKVAAVDWLNYSFRRVWCHRARAFLIPKLKTDPRHNRSCLTAHSSLFLLFHSPEKLHVTVWYVSISLYT